MIVVFETHATSLDNEAGLASGWFDVELSPLGERQAVALGERRAEEPLDVVFCSDLRRSWRTAELAFSGRPVPIVRDPRLRECDYGEWTRRSAGEVEEGRLNRIDVPFPGGQSYRQVADQVKQFLEHLPSKGNRRVLIVGHRATHYSLEHWLQGIPLTEAIARPWRWQPGWTYRLEAMP